MSKLTKSAGWATLLLALGLAGCSDSPAGPSSGAMRVAVLSTGVEIDLNGYNVSVDGGTDFPIASNGAVVLGGLAVGVHTVGLAGLAANCTVSGANPQNLRVTGTDTVTAFFQVACTSTRGTLQVTATTTGTDLDPNGYVVGIQNGGSFNLGPNQSLSFPGTPAGAYTATILGVASNCTLNGPATRTFTITGGATTQLPIQVTCIALPTILGFPFSDPAGDTLANPGGGGPQAIDLQEITGAYKADSLIMTLRFAAPIRPSGVQAPNSVTGFLEFDTDENVSTGSRPATNEFGGNAPLGVDYAISLTSSVPGDTTTVQVYSPSGGGSPFPARAEYSGSLVTLRIPLGLFGNDDGNFKFAGVIGRLARPTDVAPNAGVYTARRPGTSAQIAPVRTSGSVPTLSGPAMETSYTPSSWSGRN